MELEATEKDGRLLIDMEQNHTLANLIRKAVFEGTDGEAAYDTGHPLGEESSLVVESDDPQETLEEAIDQAREWMDGVESEL